MSSISKAQMSCFIAEGLKLSHDLNLKAYCAFRLCQRSACKEELSGFANLILEIKFYLLFPSCSMHLSLRLSPSNTLLTPPLFCESHSLVTPLSLICVHTDRHAATTHRRHTHLLLVTLTPIFFLPGMGFFFLFPERCITIQLVCVTDVWHLA